MASPLDRWLTAFAEAVRVHSGNKLAACLHLNHPDRTRLITQLKHVSLEDKLAGKLEGPWIEVAGGHLNFLVADSEGKTDEAYSHLSNAGTAIVRAFQTHTNWTTPALDRFFRNLRYAASKADRAAKQVNKKPEKLEDAVRLLNKAVGFAINDRSTSIETSKTLAALSIINHLFKIYFSLKNLRLCKSLINNVKNPRFPSLDQFPLSQRVTYRYFYGRLLMLDGNYSEAREELKFAFQHCTRRSMKNKQLILTYLVPVELIHGSCPTEALLRKYNLPQFIEVTRALRAGNLLLFNESLNREQEFFIRKGIYLILEKLTMITYRNLFKRIATLKGSNKLPLALFTRIFKWMGVDIDTDEVECILANLIYAHYIKGYIAHKQGYLVLKEEDAFPPLSEVKNPFLSGSAITQ